MAFKKEPRHSVVLVERPSDWVAKTLTDSPDFMQPVRVLLRGVKYGLAKKVTEAYNRSPVDPGLWAVLVDGDLVIQTLPLPSQP